MSTDFFQREDRAKLNTTWLVCGLALGLAATIGACYVPVIASIVAVRIADDIHHFNGESFKTSFSPSLFWQPMIFLWVAVVAGIFVLGASLYRIIQLHKDGGAGIAIGMGGREIQHGTTDPNEKKFWDVVEEMAIASEMPMPRVFVLDREDKINAFAAGWSSKDAVIGVTHGALCGLTRDELQGIVGHEFSHIVNGDMRINIRLMGITFGLLAIAVVGGWMIEAAGSTASGSGKKNGLLIPIIITIILGAILIAIGWLGAFFADLMQAAISRQREALADAAAVQFTRNPEGLAGALKQIGAAGCEVSSFRAREASHLFFGECDEPSCGLLATHPELAARIRLLDPAWDGQFPKPRFVPQAVPSPSPTMPRRATSAVHTEPSPKVAGHLAKAAQDPAVASAMVCAMLLDGSDAGVRAKQLASVADADLAAGIQRVSYEIRPLWKEVRSTLLHECLPALRRLSPQALSDLRVQANAMRDLSGDESVQAVGQAIAKELA